MMMLWAWAGVPLGVYNIVEDFNVALRVQPQILTFLSLVTWIQCYYYERVLKPLSFPLLVYLIHPPVSNHLAPALHILDMLADWQNRNGPSCAL
jgi:hypothetical protein